MLHSIYDQPDADAVHAQFDRVVEALHEKLPKVAEHLEQARADILASTVFPKEIWRQIWSNNPNERPEPGDPPPHRRGRDLPRPSLRDPLHRSGPGRAAHKWAEGRRYLGLDVLGRSRLAPIKSTQTGTDKEDLTPAALTA